jgi:hypothetical protein
MFQSLQIICAPGSIDSVMDVLDGINESADSPVLSVSHEESNVFIVRALYSDLMTVFRSFNGREDVWPAFV